MYRSKSSASHPSGSAAATSATSPPLASSSASSPITASTPASSIFGSSSLSSESSAWWLNTAVAVGGTAAGVGVVAVASFLYNWYNSPSASSSASTPPSHAAASSSSSSSSSSGSSFLSSASASAEGRLHSRRSRDRHSGRRRKSKSSQLKIDELANDDLSEDSNGYETDADGETEEKEKSKRKHISGTKSASSSTIASTSGSLASVNKDRLRGYLKKSREVLEEQMTVYDDLVQRTRQLLLHLNDADIASFSNRLRIKIAEWLILFQNVDAFTSSRNAHSFAQFATESKAMMDCAWRVLQKVDTTKYAKKRRTSPILSARADSPATPTIAAPSSTSPTLEVDDEEEDCVDERRLDIVCLDIAHRRKSVQDMLHYFDKIYARVHRRMQRSAEFIQANAIRSAAAKAVTSLSTSSSSSSSSSHASGAPATSAAASSADVLSSSLSSSSFLSPYNERELVAIFLVSPILGRWRQCHELGSALLHQFASDLVRSPSEALPGVPDYSIVYQMSERERMYADNQLNDVLFQCLPIHAIKLLITEVTDEFDESEPNKESHFHRLLSLSGRIATVATFDRHRRRGDEEYFDVLSRSLYREGATVQMTSPLNLCLSTSNASSSSSSPLSYDSLASQIFPRTPTDANVVSLVGPIRGVHVRCEGRLGDRRSESIQLREVKRSECKDFLKTAATRAMKNKVAAQQLMNRLATPPQSLTASLSFSTASLISVSASPNNPTSAQPSEVPSSSTSTSSEASAAAAGASVSLSSVASGASGSASASAFMTSSSLSSSDSSVEMFYEWSNFSSISSDSSLRFFIGDGVSSSNTSAATIHNAKSRIHLRFAIIIIVNNDAPTLI